MYDTEVLSKSRLFLNDSSATPRWTDAELLEWCDDGIREIRKIRPDSQIDDDGERIDFEELPATGFYSYDETGGHDDYTSGYDMITGWDRDTYPTLYLVYLSAGTALNIYATAAARTAGVGRVGYATIGSAVGLKTVTAAAWTTMGGTISCDTIMTNLNTWEVTAAQRELILSDDYKSALAHWIAYRGFIEDSDDEQNQRLAKMHLDLFMGELK
jgi:hypothetical protein